MSAFTIILCILGASQLYWLWRAHLLAARLFPQPVRRRIMSGIILAAYVFLFAFNFFSFATRRTPVDLTPVQAIVVGPFLCWIASSLAAFLVVVVLAAIKGVAYTLRRITTRPAAPASDPVPASPSRRQLLQSAGNVVVASPFVAGVYGMLYGRLNLEITEHRVAFERLPRAFHGFRIAQLSDIHIGPFMTEREIRKYVAIANEQKPDLMVLTGDFVTFDPGTQQAVVDALAGLRAPFGVFGSLGNHDMWSRVEDSITELFRAAGIRILRGSNVAITAGGDSFNLMGVDFQSRRAFGPSAPVAHILGNIEPLVSRERINILLSHNPDTFDRAAELGIELSLAGHTHGGQAALEFISPEIAPSRLVTPYVAGWFRKPGSRLYVNRGIGTVGPPIRIGAPPEITIYQLMRG